MTSKAPKPLSILGLGAAACVACCIGPLLALLAATGLFTAVGTALFGAAGLVALAPAAIWYARRRRRTTPCTVPEDRPVPVVIAGRSRPPAEPAASTGIRRS